MPTSLAVEALAVALAGGGVTAADFDAIAKAGPPDGADVSTPGGAAAAKKKRERTQAQVGLASNAVGIAAGTAGLREVSQRDAFRDGGKAGKAIYRAGGAAGKIPGLKQAGELVARHPGKAAVGALSLQAANLAGDAVSNRVLARSSKKDPVGKALLPGATKIQSMGLVRANGRATRMGLRGRKPVQKGMLRNVADAGRMAGHAADGTIRDLGQANGLAGSRANRAPGAHRGGGRPRVTPAVAGAGLVATGGVGATAVGARRRRQTQAVPDSTVAKTHDVEWRGTISKVDDEKRLVFGFCSVSKVDGQPVVDRQGDYIPLEETEKAAYKYVVESRVGGDMHRRVAKFGGDKAHKVSDLVESMVVTPEKLSKMGVPDDLVDKIPHGWWIGQRIHDDDAWAAVKGGDRVSFSIHGSGIRKDMS